MTATGQVAVIRRLWVLAPWGAPGLAASRRRPSVLCLCVSAFSWLSGRVARRDRASGRHHWGRSGGSPSRDGYPQESIRHRVLLASRVRQPGGAPGLRHRLGRLDSSGSFRLTQHSHPERLVSRDGHQGVERLGALLSQPLRDRPPAEDRLRKGKEVARQPTAAANSVGWHQPAVMPSGLGSADVGLA